MVMRAATAETSGLVRRISEPELKKALLEALHDATRTRDPRASEELFHLARSTPKALATAIELEDNILVQVAKHGVPLLDIMRTSRARTMKELIDYIRSTGVQARWYLANDVVLASHGHAVHLMHARPMVIGSHVTEFSDHGPLVLSTADVVWHTWPSLRTGINHTDFGLGNVSPNELPTRRRHLSVVKD